MSIRCPTPLVSVPPHGVNQFRSLAAAEAAGAQASRTQIGLRCWETERELATSELGDASRAHLMWATDKQGRAGWAWAPASRESSRTRMKPETSARPRSSSAGPPIQRFSSLTSHASRSNSLVPQPGRQETLSTSGSFTIPAGGVVGSPIATIVPRSLQRVASPLAAITRTGVRTLESSLPRWQATWTERQEAHDRELRDLREEFEVQRATCEAFRQNDWILKWVTEQKAHKEECRALREEFNVERDKWDAYCTSDLPKQLAEMQDALTKEVLALRKDLEAQQGEVIRLGKIQEKGFEKDASQSEQLGKICEAVLLQQEKLDSLGDYRRIAQKQETCAEDVRALRKEVESLRESGESLGGNRWQARRAERQEVQAEEMRALRHDLDAQRETCEALGKRLAVVSADLTRMPLHGAVSGELALLRQRLQEIESRVEVVFRPRDPELVVADPSVVRDVQEQDQLKHKAGPASHDRDPGDQAFKSLEMTTAMFAWYRDGLQRLWDELDKEREDHSSNLAEVRESLHLEMTQVVDEVERLARGVRRRCTELEVALCSARALSRADAAAADPEPLLSQIDEEEGGPEDERDSGDDEDSPEKEEEDEEYEEEGEIHPRLASFWSGSLGRAAMEAAMSAPAATSSPTSDLQRQRQRKGRDSEVLFGDGQQHVEAKGQGKEAVATA